MSSVAPAPPVFMNRASRLGTAVLAMVLAGCITTTHRVHRTSEDILDALNVSIDIPKGWSVSRSPLHFMNTEMLRVKSVDGVVFDVELTNEEVQDLDGSAARVRQTFFRRFNGGRFKTVHQAVGGIGSTGFTGSIRPEEGGKVFRLLYCCFNVPGRHVSIQVQGEESVWLARQGEIAQLLQGLHVGESPRP